VVADVEAGQAGEGGHGMTLRFDPRYTAFGLLSTFLEAFIEAQGLPPFYVPAKPETYQGMVLSAAAADCIHKHARLIADELTKDCYQPEATV
jgi:hypothetical protein